MTTERHPELLCHMVRSNGNKFKQLAPRAADHCEKVG
jgi:hypothetical protein